MSLSMKGAKRLARPQLSAGTQWAIGRLRGLNKILWSEGPARDTAQWLRNGDPVEWIIGEITVDSARFGGDRERLQSNECVKEVLRAALLRDAIAHDLTT